MKLGRGLLLSLGLTLFTGCPSPYFPPVKSGATVTPAELPEEVDKLTAYVDAEMERQSVSSAENALVAVDKGITLDARSYDLLWRGARACAWLTEEFEKARRAEVARRGAEYARRALEIDASRAEAHYYLGINLGQLATTKTVGGHPLVPQVIKEAEAANFRPASPKSP